MCWRRLPCASPPSTRNNPPFQTERTPEMQYTVTQNQPLTQTVYRLTLAGDTRAITRPGQFVQVAVPGYYLRRPISVYDWRSADNGSLTLVYKTLGHGTEAMPRRVPNHLQTKGFQRRRCFACDGRASPLGYSHTFLLPCDGPCGWYALSQFPFYFIVIYLSILFFREPDKPRLQAFPF